LRQIKLRASTRRIVLEYRLCRRQIMSLPAAILAFASGLMLSLWGIPSYARPAQQFLAQSEIQIPSETDLDRINRQDLQGAPSFADPGATGSIESQIQGMDRQDREIDQRVSRGICRYCE